MRGRSDKVVEAVSRRKIDLCCLQEATQCSARMLSGKYSRFKFFWIGNDRGTGGVGILLAGRVCSWRTFYKGRASLIGST